MLAIVFPPLRPLENWGGENFQGGKTFVYVVTRWRVPVSRGAETSIPSLAIVVQAASTPITKDIS